MRATVLLLTVFAGAALGQQRVPMPSTSEGTFLTGNLKSALFDQLEAALDSQNLPTGWIEQLRNDPPDIRFSNIGDNQGLYQPAWQGPLGNGLAGDTIHLVPGLSPLHLTSDDISTITHEAWHAWFDLVPNYVTDPIGRLSDAQDEAIGGFIGELVVGNGISKAVNSAINEAVGREGTAQQVVDAIQLLESTWSGSFFANGFVNDKDVRDWEVLRRSTPEIQALESHLSAADRQRIQDRIDELQRARQADEALGEDELDEQASLAPDGGGLWGAPLSTGTGSLVNIGETSYPSDGSLALSPVGGSAFTNAPVSDVGGFVNLGPGTLNVPSATSAGREGSVQVMIVMFLEGTVPGSRQAGRQGRLASLAPAVLPQAGDGPPLKASIRALGISSGEAFEVEVVNEQAYPIELAAAGVVVEPLRARDGEKVLDEVERSGEPTLHLKADGYCLEYERQPPPEGTAFRVAGPELQKRYQPMRSVLRAAKKLLDAGGLTPDSDPELYFHAIVQWALWTKEQGFDAQSFGEAFLDRTRKNFEAARQPFTREIEATVRGLAPNRWNDVESVLDLAETLAIPP